MTYDFEFFKNEFSLLEPQAKDYATAYKRIRYLLQDYDLLRRNRQHPYAYYEEALDVLKSIDTVQDRQSAYLLLNGLFNKDNTAKGWALKESAQALLWIRDLWVWPVEAY